MQYDDDNGFYSIGIRSQLHLLEKKILRTVMDKARFNWLLFTDKYCRVNLIWL